jgi:hypothetical protein
MPNDVLEAWSGGNASTSGVPWPTLRLVTSVPLAWLGY